MLYKVTVNCIKNNAFLPQEVYILPYDKVVDLVSYLLLIDDMSTQITWSAYKEEVE